VRPGTVVTLCSAGAARELESWTRQLGSVDFAELEAAPRGQPAP
jgi:hypothetical protein